MLRPAVLLDAAMTARAALDRLARNGFWLDASDTGAKEFLAEWVAATTVTDDDADADADAPTAAITTKDAADLLRRPLDTGRVAIRREQGATVYWYTMDVTHVLRALLGGGVSRPVLIALDLHEHGSVRAEQVDRLPTPDSLEQGVALRGQELVGVGEPSPLPAARGGVRSASVAPGGMSERGAAAGAEPPRVDAYPDIAIANDTVVVGAPFDVGIGLRRDPAPGQRAAERMTIVGRLGATSIPVEVQVVADGFEAVNGWRHVLDVDVDDPVKARVVVTLRALPLGADQPTRQTTIIVQFAVDGVMCGSHSRQLLVKRAESTAVSEDSRGISWTHAQPAPPPLTIGTMLVAPDVELNIAKPDGNHATGDYACTMRNAHGVPVPDAPIRISLGEDASTFAKGIIDGMRIYDGGALLGNWVKGNGRTIAGKLPTQFWQMLRDVAAKVPGRPLTLQLNSAEPYVPWELATMKPPLDPSRPAVLAAQVAMGRWILGDGVASPPRDEVRVRAMAAMAAKYKAINGLRPLPEAEKEVQHLKETYNAVTYKCDESGLNALLDASVGGAEVVHFAGHGLVNPERPGDAAIYLENGQPLSPVFFLDTTLGEEHAPFVFLNACMVGTGGELLGSYGGFPGSCLAGGFSALVAPLWAVNDTVASTIAKTFYEQAFATPPRPVAEVLRDVRKSWADDPKVSSYLAYVYYGNPNLRVARA